MRRLKRFLGLTLALLLLPALLAQESKTKTDPPGKAPSEEKETQDGKKDGDKPAPKDGKKNGDKPAPKDGKKDNGKTSKPAKKEIPEKLPIGSQLAGKLLRWDTNQKSFTLEVSIPVRVLNQGVLNNINNLQFRLRFARSPQEAFDLQQQLVRERALLYQVQEQKKQVEIQVAPDMKVRLATPPVTFDEKGKVKRLSAKELQELKGPNPRLPGYLGELSDIRQDSMVTVYLAKSKTPPRKFTGKTGDLDKLSLESRPEALMILLHAEVQLKP